MINFLHHFSPSPIFLHIGPIPLYWYGLMIVGGIIAAMLISFRLGKKYYNISADEIFDISFWLIIWGVIGARIYDIFLQLPYYIYHPWQTLAIWKGGLAIHGSIIAGLLVLFYFSRRKQISFFKITALFAPGLALGQAIGRFGNYFNQELFGRPTNLPWGIPINLENRPLEYITDTYFHPTFLYESVGCLIIFFILCLLHRLYKRRQKLNETFYVLLTAAYMILYSILRFSLEFIRIDYAPTAIGLRWPQLASLIIIFISIITLIYQKHVWNKKKK